MKQTIFIMMLKYYFSFFSCVKICYDGAKAMVSKTTGAFVSINTVVPKSSIAHCILHCLALVAFFLKQGCLRDVLNEVVKITYFTESLCLNMHLFNILCDVMKYM